MVACAGRREKMARGMRMGMGRDGGPGT
jgi:hypothetical protein